MRKKGGYLLFQVDEYVPPPVLGPRCHRRRAGRAAVVVGGGQGGDREAQDPQRLAYCGRQESLRTLSAHHIDKAQVSSRSILASLLTDHTPEGMRLL